MRADPRRDRPCKRCGDPDPILGHHCWDERRGRAAVLRALHAAGVHNPEVVAVDILDRLRGDDLIPGRFAPQPPEVAT